MKLFSTEAVSKYHPDKYADQISDAILTECLRQDATSHCGIETLVKDDIVVVSGEIKTEAVIDIPSIVAKVANKLHYPIRCVIDLLGTQSNEINHAVTKAESVGAGDQGIMFGYATAETDSKLPFAFDIANRIIARIEEDVDGNSSSILCGDAKTQVTVDLDTGKITDIVVSVCHKPNYSNAMVRCYVLELLSDIPAPKRWHINPAGKWTVGGPTADCGLTGRKIVCDQYGGFCAVGGGALSGKDPSKVDRTATYMARQIACDLVDKFGLKECTVQLGFVIGSETPISVCVDADSEIDLSAYQKGEDGQPEIVPHEAAIVERIFNMFLAGQPINIIADTLRDENIEIPGKNIKFSKGMIMSVLRNEKYCGDCILQKTVTVDCISKTRKKNEGEAPMYIVENSHPAIVSREIFNRTQEELSRRNARTPLSQKTALTATGKYSKYALTDVLICEECGSRYKRVTWSARGKKTIVWRCVNRLDHGIEYCKNSPTLHEEALHKAIVRALNRFNAEDESTYLTLMKATIGEAVGLNGGSDEIDLLERRIEALNKRMLELVNASVLSGEDVESHEDEFKDIAEQTEQLKRRIQAIRESESNSEATEQRLQEMQEIIDSRNANHDTYDDSIVRQMIECIKVGEEGKLRIIFGGGYEIEEHI